MKRVQGVEVTGNLKGTADLDLGNDTYGVSCSATFGWEVKDGLVVLSNTSGSVALNDDAEDFVIEVEDEIGKYLVSEGYNMEEYND